MERILVLGASGTVGAAVFRQLSQNVMFDVYGTYFRKESDNPRMRFFSLENHEWINDLLEEIAPSIVISALRGDFGQSGSYIEDSVCIWEKFCQNASG